MFLTANTVDRAVPGCKPDPGASFHYLPKMPANNYHGNTVAEVIVGFTTTNAVSASVSYKPTNNRNKHKMRPTLTILIYLLVDDFSAQQTELLIA